MIIYFYITFFPDLTYYIYFIFEKQAFNGLFKVIGIQKQFNIFSRLYLILYRLKIIVHTFRGMAMYRNILSINRNTFVNQTQRERDYYSKNLSILNISSNGDLTLF